MNSLIKDNLFKICFIIITIIAILIRTLHLLYNPLFYGDEIGLLNNISNLNYTNLLKGLNSVQAAPPVFLLIEKFIYEIVKNQTQYIIELSLRLLPFLCNIISIFTFYQFNNLIFNQNKNKIIAFLIFTINTQNVAYSAIFKQYSLELLISTILLLLSFNIIFKNTYKWYYTLIISFAVWFSYSSIFIILPLLIYIFMKKRTIFKQIVLPLMLSFILLYNLSIKWILSSSYIAMKECWEGLSWGYIDLYHPTRIFIRFGEFFVFGASTPNKIVTIICGLLIIYLVFAFIFSRNKYKYFLLTPILLVIIASILHKYPIVVRLILFLWPIISIIIASYKFKFKKIFLSIVSIISILSCLYYVPNSFSLNLENRNQIEYSKGYLNLYQK